MKTVVSTVLWAMTCLSCMAQPIIYNDTQSLITGTWEGNGTLTEVTDDSPFEGSYHYAFNYNFTGYWAGLGLNFDNFSDPPSGYDFSSYTHLRIAYRGLTSDHQLKIVLRTGNDSSNRLTVGIANTAYQIVDIPLFAFEAGTSLDLTNISEIDLSVISDIATGSSTVYFDAIELINDPPATSTSATTWARADSYRKGINLSNWLEAYWLIPFNAYPDTDKFTATDITAFNSLGFEAIRLPVTFEHLAAQAPPYALDLDHPTFDLIDDAIAWADANDMKLIIDMHHGSQELNDNNYLTQLPRLESIWQQLTTLYSSLDPDRYFFEVYNEPFAISNTNWRTVAEALVQVLRDAGMDHTVILGASGYNSAADLVDFAPINDPDILYTFHFYEPFTFTHQQVSWTSPPNLPARDFPEPGETASMTTLFTAVNAWSDFYDAPVMLGEFGVTSPTDSLERCEWVTFVSGLIGSYDMAWYYWDAVNTNEGFGFFADNTISGATMDDCFATALGLGAAALHIESLGPLQLNCAFGQPILQWQLLSDESGQIEIQGFANTSQTWKTIAEVDMRLQRTTYRYLPAGDYPLYRLRIRALDGTLHLSQVVSNSCWSPEQWSLHPNPIDKHWQLRTPLNGPIDLSIYNQLGQLVYQYTSRSVSAATSTTFARPPLSAGLYQLCVRQQGRPMQWLPFLLN